MTVVFPRLGQAGRLGNQLWQAASTIGIAAARNDEVFLPPDWDYRPYLSLPDDFYGPQHGTDAASLVPHIDERARVYLQDYGLFRAIEPTIRTLFRPSPLAQSRLDHPAQVKITDLPRPLISVHVRRGDNVTHPPGYHPLRSRDYFEKAIQLVPVEGTVVAFSDDPFWCQEFLTEWIGRDCVIYQGVTRPREYVDRAKYDASAVLDWIDVFLMAQCDHHILSNSSYSWWGAFLSDNPSPIYPSNWYGFHLPYIDTSLMFPPGWIQVEDPTQGGI